MIRVSGVRVPPAYPRPARSLAPLGRKRGVFVVRPNPSGTQRNPTVPSRRSAATRTLSARVSVNSFGIGTLILMRSTARLRVDEPGHARDAAGAPAEHRAGLVDVGECVRGVERRGLRAASEGGDSHRFSYGATTRRRVQSMPRPKSRTQYGVPFVPRTTSPCPRARSANAPTRSGSPLVT